MGDLPKQQGTLRGQEFVVISVIPHSPDGAAILSALATVLG
jgi:hypothetical protein